MHALGRATVEGVVDGAPAAFAVDVVPDASHHSSLAEPSKGVVRPRLALALVLRPLPRAVLLEAAGLTRAGEMHRAVVPVPTAQASPSAGRSRSDPILRNLAHGLRTRPSALGRPGPSASRTPRPPSRRPPPSGRPTTALATPASPPRPPALAPRGRRRAARGCRSQSPA